MLVSVHEPWGEQFVKRFLKFFLTHAKEEIFLDLSQLIMYFLFYYIKESGGGGQQKKEAVDPLLILCFG